ncbi:hypothetical protein ACKS0A_11664 [Histoplasma ohiense]
MLISLFKPSIVSLVNFIFTRFHVLVLIRIFVIFRFGHSLRLPTLLLPTAGPRTRNIHIPKQFPQLGLPSLLLRHLFLSPPSLQFRLIIPLEFLPLFLHRFKEPIDPITSHSTYPNHIEMSIKFLQHQTHTIQK